MRRKSRIRSMKRKKPKRSPTRHPFRKKRKRRTKPPKSIPRSPRLSMNRFWTQHRIFTGTIYRGCLRSKKYSRKLSYSRLCALISSAASTPPRRESCCTARLALVRPCSRRPSPPSANQHFSPSALPLSRPSGWARARSSCADFSRWQMRKRRP